MLRRIGVEMNQRLVLMTLPYIFLASFMRVMEDAGMIPKPWVYAFISPLIFFLVFGVAVVTLVIFRSRMEAYPAVGTILASVSLCTLLPLMKNSWVLSIPAILLAAIPISLISRKIGAEFLENHGSSLALTSHLVDACSTYVGIDLMGSYVPKHVVEGAIVNLTGSAALMIPIKGFVVLLVLYLIHRYSDEDRVKNLLILVVLTLGLGPGMRNCMRMAVGA